MNKCSECGAENTLVVQVILTTHWPVVARGFPEGKLIVIGSPARTVASSQEMLLCTACGYGAQLEVQAETNVFKVLERPAVAAIDDEERDIY